MGGFAPGRGSGTGEFGLGNVWDIGSGLYGLYQSGQTRKLAEQASRMNDPFGPYRGQYAQELSALRADPSQVERIPGYQAGLNAVERKMASQGYLGSGNMMAALSQYGGDFFDKEVGRLSLLAGAQFAPRGGDALMTGNAQATDLAGNALNRLGYGILGRSSPSPNDYPWIIWN